MRAGRPPHDETSNPAALAWRGGGHFASNSGNMLFSDAMYRVLNTSAASVTCDAYLPERYVLSDDQISHINDTYSAYVIPLANAFRDSFLPALNRLTTNIERLTIPVVVGSVGCQLDLDDAHATISDDVAASTRRFVSAILDHSPQIGVRGDTTRRVLLNLGFHDADIAVIGCPSMFSRTRTFSVAKTLDRLSTDSLLATNFEAGNTNFGTAGAASDEALSTVYSANENAYSHLTSVFQTLDGANLVLWGQLAKNFPEGTPRSSADSAYAESRLRFFTNTRSWCDFMSTQDFSFGIRIHGAIAALVSGTPAYLLSVDSRTQELGDYHGIPRQSLTSAVESGHYLAQDFYEQADFTEFNARMPENWDRYYAYLEACGLHHIHEAGFENPDYDQVLRTFHPTPGMAPISLNDPEGLAERFLWLRQDRDRDHWRPVHNYHPDFELDAELSEKVRSPQGVIKDLRKAVAAEKTTSRNLQRRLDEQAASLRTSQEKSARLSSTLATAQKEIEELQRFRTEASQSFGTRLAKAIKRRLHLK